MIGGTIHVGAQMLKTEITVNNLSSCVGLRGDTMMVHMAQDLCATEFKPLLLEHLRLSLAGRHVEK